MTAAQIARRMDITPSSKFIDLLIEMQFEGDLTFEWVQRSGRWDTRLWTLAPGTYATPKKRTVVINHNGQRGQLELL